MSTDFTSALFLDLHHPHAALPPWSTLTTGRPAAIARPVPIPSRPRVAELVGADDAVLRRTAFHALLDTIVALARPGGTVVVDEAAYPISHWAAGAAATQGVHVVHFRHHDPEHAAATCRGAARAVVVSDGWCGSCNRPAPLARLVAATEASRAAVVVDDSLAMGVIGRREPGGSTFGAGGQGLAPWLGVRSERLVTLASLAKAYGTPLAVIGGHRSAVRTIDGRSSTTVHSSPPTNADRAALEVVTRLPTAVLDVRRRRLDALSRELRVRVRRLGVRPIGLPFPLVLIDVPGSAAAVADQLGRDGVRVLPLRTSCARRDERTAIGVALRSGHGVEDLDRLERGLEAALSSDARSGAA